MITKKFSAAAAALTASAALIVSVPTTADALPNYPEINRHFISFRVDGAMLVCGEGNGGAEFQCQSTSYWEQDGKTYGMVEFDFDEGTAYLLQGGNFDTSKTPFRLKEGKKYIFEDMVVQGKKGKLYFSTPDYHLRGELTGSDISLFDTD